MPKKTYREVLARASSFLEKQGKEGHAIQFLVQERKDWSTTDWLLHMNEEISAADEAQIQVDVARLMENYPPQYLIGAADFYNKRVEVTEDTLIPRPETEELVDLCLKENPAESLRVVDVGVGTGAIAVVLKAERPSWQVSGSDISLEALAVAKRNAAKYGLIIDFRQGSVLEPFSAEKFDLIISNPPYISGDEWALMDESVRSFEPKTALFAENNGLAIYQQIAKEAQGKLTAEGKIYLEIGFQQGEAVKEIFTAAFPNKRIRVKQDLSGKDRMVVIDSSCE